ncbi:arylsulfatase B-like [Littorina saxatilis]|uniref:Sulfatase N-terminal domain-containing protein n=1 Tax=Littorina saxatilis TaxID=31220 RepID=A0AAN9ALN7_9CAEN
MAPKLLASTFLVTCFLSCAVAQPVPARKKPNILFVLMDDMGWGDVGFRDSQFHTPTIDGMYSQGVRFNNSYTPPNCGPSRAALLSGVYPWRMGLQGNAINSGSSAAIPLGRTILPQKLKDDLGYQTHLVGKWHQGFCKTEQTPTERGFDSFFGFYLSKQDPFSHLSKKDAYDFRSDHEVNRSVAGQYSTYLFSERTRQLVREYKDSLASNADTKPFFIMLSYSALHAPNQVPQHYIDQHCADVSDHNRQIKCGMMAAVDEGLKNITDDLKAHGLMDDLLVVFTSDDGGDHEEGSSNWPLRGNKRTLWEGGIRVNTFMYSESRDILPETNFTWGGLFYISDFYATLSGMIEDTETRKLPEIVDSYNQWTYIKTGQTTGTNRLEIAYVDQDLGVAMLRRDQWKLLYMQSRHPGWYNPPPGVTAREEPNRNDLPKYQLFDLDRDPEETTDVRKDNYERYIRMAASLREVRRMAVNPIDEDLHSDPDRFDGVWSPGWC